MDIGPRDSNSIPAVSLCRSYVVLPKKIFVRVNFALYLNNLPCRRAVWFRLLHYANPYEERLQGSDLLFFAAKNNNSGPRLSEIITKILHNQSLF